MLQKNLVALESGAPASRSLRLLPPVTLSFSETRRLVARSNEVVRILHQFESGRTRLIPSQSSSRTDAEKQRR